MKSKCSAAWLLLTGLLLSAVFAGCARSQAARVATTPAIPVQLATAQREDVPRTIESIGNVQALRTVSVKSQVDGVIQKVGFHEGDEVAEGDLLVTLDRRPFENVLRIAQADLANARAEEAAARADAERYSALFAQKVVAKEELTPYMTKAATTLAQVQQKEAAVANAELQLGYTQIRAPFSGRTGQLLLHEGALVKANDSNSPIVTLNQIAPIAVTFSVPEDNLAAMREALAAQAATVSVTDRTTGRKRTDGRLDFVDNAVDATTGSVTLKSSFPNAGHELWPGQFVSVVTQIGIDRGAIVVPSSAVLTSQDGAQVYVVKADKTVELRPVKVARTVGDRTLLSDGVRENEIVVSDGQLRLVPGAKVEGKQAAGGRKS